MTANFKALFREPTMLFPCAAGVQIPQMGVEDAKIKPLRGKSLHSKFLPIKFVPQDANPVNDAYVKMVSTGLSFSEDVVVDRCMDMVPYNSKYFNDVFEPGGLVTVPPRAHSSMGRHNKRGTDVRHMPCYLKKTIKPKPLTPLRKQAKEKALMLHKQALLADNERKSNAAENESDALHSSFFITEPKDIKTYVPLESIPEAKGKSITSDKDKLPKEKLISATKEKTGKKKEGKVAFSLKVDSKPNDAVSGSSKTHIEESARGDWDDHLMSRLSKLTANWIVHERMMPEEKTKEKLTKTLETWYGPPTHTDLVREEISDGEENDERKQKKKPKAKWKNKQESLLARVYNVTPPPVEALDPYSDDSKAPFYRQPAGIRKKKKTVEKEEAVKSMRGENNTSDEGENCKCLVVQ